VTRVEPVGLTRPAIPFIMSFDQNSNRPAVNFRKWTTKVNIGIIGGVLLLLVIGMVITFCVK
jgi:hypothetical protein